jgi:cob(I)alamin adenosyltransferase
LNEVEAVEAILLQYLNRLSDYFFVLGRYQGQILQVEEVVWRPRT